MNEFCDYRMKQKITIVKNNRDIKTLKKIILILYDDSDY